MDIKVIQHIADWQSARTEWQDVFQSNVNLSPYQSFEWLSHWWHYLGTGTLYILRVADADGRVIGFAPLHMRRKYYGVPVKHLAFIGVKRTDYLDFLVRPGQEDAFFQALFTFLKERQQEFRFIELRDFPDSSTNFAALTRHAGRIFPVYQTESSRICVSIPLTADWQSYLGTLGKRTRKDVGYDRRYLAKRHEIRMAHFRNGQEFDKGYADLVEVYKKRWDAEKGATRYSEDDASHFEAAAAKSLSKRGDYRLWMLYADEAPVAALAGYEHNNKLFADVYAHVPAFHKLSVGNVVLGHAIEACIDNGLTEFDLSRGEERYKYKWNGQAKRNYHLKIYRSHADMALTAALEHAYHKATNSTTLLKIQSRIREWKYGKS